MTLPALSEILMSVAQARDLACAEGLGEVAEILQSAGERIADIDQAEAHAEWEARRVAAR